MPLFFEALQVAAVSLGEAALICTLGGVAMAQGHLDGDSLKRVSRFMLRLFYPCMMLSLYDSFDAERLARWSPVLLVPVAHIAVGVLLGQLASRLLRVCAPYRQLTVISCAFGNCAALPFVLAVPVVQNWSRTKDDLEALETAQGIIGLYLGVWCLLFFGFGQRYLIHAAGGVAPPKESASNAAATASAGAACWRRTCHLLGDLVDRNTVCTVVAILLGCTPPLRWVLSGGPLRWVSGAWDQIGGAGVTLSIAILGASLQPTLQRSLPRCCRGGREQAHETRTSTRTSTAAAQAGGAAGGAEVESRKEKAEAEDGVAVAAVLPAVVLAVATDAPAASSVAGSADEDARSARRMVLASALVKLVLVPAVSIPLITLLAQRTAFPADPAVLMILHIQSGVPSAQTAISVLVAAGQATLAQQLAKLYVLQYVLSALSLAVVIVVAVEMI